VHIQNVIKLIDEGSTIPFIARYRKELHGAMDDTQLRELDDRLNQLRTLNSRRDAIITSIENQGKMTQEILDAVENAATMSELEDIYRPYKQKRRTRATIAREKGLDPLAAAIYMQSDKKPEDLALDYIDPEKGVNSIEDALLGASDIIAETISDNASIRMELRNSMLKYAKLITKKAKDEDSVYQLYYEFEKDISKMAGHQVLAINRGEKEEFLKVSVSYDLDRAMNIICSACVKKGPCADFVKNAAQDAYDRLIFPSMEREMRNILSESANEGAIKMFGQNLKPLLLQPPIKGSVTLGLDPAYRTGCKLAVIDPTGKVLDTNVIYPTPPHNKVKEAERTVLMLIKKHGIRHIAIGNGTASRESEKFVADMIRDNALDVKYMIVNEAGASVYSASPLGAKEFPEYDVSLRSAVSIARRMQDPLAELVKIDPKAIGVGQYQHDMPEARLDETLNGVVEDCVNSVGVDVNTASPSLLERVSGLTSATAKNIVEYRAANGAFTDRKQLLKVSKLGPKAFEQCAGFLRVVGGKKVLDNTSVHPESYAAAEKLMEICNVDIEHASRIPLALKNIGEENAANICGVGVPTLRDIVKELQKPGRDIRDELPPPVLRGDVLEMKDLKPGMELTGTVRNVIDFGAFVDIGVHQDGLVHISQISNKFIRHPSEILKVGDIVKVWVISVDTAKKRISLTMKKP